MYFKDTACFCHCAYFLRSRSGHGHARVNCSLVTQVVRNFWTEYFLVKGGDSTAPLRLGFDSWSWLHTWVEFVVRRFLSGMFGFSSRRQKQHSKFQFWPGNDGHWVTYCKFRSFTPTLIVKRKVCFLYHRNSLLIMVWSGLEMTLLTLIMKF